MRPKSACKTLRKARIATEYVTGGSVIGGQGRNDCGEDTAPITSLDLISTENDSSMVCHAECCSGWFMIRIDLCEWVLHPNDL